ncbi:MAG: lacZ [Phycisphaerales bacterium]|nr:lacZ [Phycisphaerales bacterium]
MPRTYATALAAALLALSAVPARGQSAPATDEAGGPAAQGWRPVPGKLMTRWAKEVSPTNARTEYPRPQLTRPRWRNLNGLWDYAIRPKIDSAQPDVAGPDAGKPNAGPPATAPAAAPAAPAAFDGKILVPYPVESALSGVGKTVGPGKALWYRRSFTVPAEWRAGGQRVLLHFGAVDWQSTVTLNGKSVGTHRGGYDPFSFDVTDQLSAGGEQVLTVAVLDPSDAGYQPRGKQVRNPQGIYYTPSTGIWQTVWIEPVPATYVRSLAVTPDANKNEVRIAAAVGGAAGGATLSAVVLDGDKEVASAKGAVGSNLVLKVPDAKRWSPDAPNLYGLRVTVGGGAGAAAAAGTPAGETVESYFAVRKLSVAKDAAGVPRLMLNDKFLFQYGPLDQGFWPDGLYTAPTDAAMKYDLAVTKRLGFNMVRKHVKVEPATWYHACDEMGLLVWQDMPSGDRGIGPNAAEDFKRSPESVATYEREWANIIEALRPFPSIVMWVPFNEGWGQSDTARIAELTKKLDPTRWVDNASGWADRGVGDVLDLHVYPGPAPSAASVRKRGERAMVLGEFGGLGLPVKGHSWQDEKNWGYRSFTTPDALTDAYLGLLARLHPLVGTPGYSAAVYTQTTDVEIEVNGLMTYDREVIKMDEARTAAAARRLYGPPPVVTEVVPDARAAPIAWRYAIEKPADGWEKPAFDDAAWQTGPAGFGTANTPGTTVRTEWKGKDIWVRRTFDLPAAAAVDRLHLSLYHDEDAEVYLNGVPAATVTGYTTEYALVPIRPEALKALKPGGQNTIAIHCLQRTGGQYIDAGIVEVK